MRDLTDHREVLYAASTGERVRIAFTDRSALRRWQTAFNSTRRHEETKIYRAWEKNVARGLTVPPPALPWEKVRTWTTGVGRLELVVGVPTPGDLGIAGTGKDTKP